jgi:acetyl esterase
MQIDPPLKGLFSALDAAPKAASDDLAAVRAQADATFMLLHQPEPGTDVTEHDCPVDGGTIRLRVRRPSGSGTLPALFHLHGGGWFQGNLDTAEVECGPMATAVGCVVISVDYRLAPEHPFPIPLEDCLAAWLWVHDHLEQLDIDPSRIAVAGASAGGNLSAALCLAARDRGLPQPLLQLLDVPATDLTGSSPSWAEVGDGAGLTETELRRFVGYYVGDADPADPYLSPVLADDLSGLAPAVVITAAHDPVRDDGERWVSALQAAGVAASGLRVLNHVHGSWIIPITITAGLVRDLRVSVLKRAFAGTLDPLAS